MSKRGEQNTLSGIGANTGIAIAKAYVYEYDRLKVELQFSANVAYELERYQKAKKKAQKELENIVHSFPEQSKERAEIFAAHINILNDEEIEKQILHNIADKNYVAEFSVYDTFSSFAEVFEKIEDPVIRERKADLMDVLYRLYRILKGKEEKDISALEEDAIIVAYDLLPSDSAALDRRHIKGILTEAGNITSHTAILARAYGIPAVLGVADLTERIEDGDLLIVDAGAGTVLIDPDEKDLCSYEKRKKEQENVYWEDMKYFLKEARTKDGIRIMFGANIGASAIETDDVKAVDCVGLFRTEFLYMEKKHLPTEEEQFEAYRSVLEAYGNKPVILRTLDIGGDKSIPYLELPREENPFLGVRAIRLCRNMPELFRTQIRAALRASAYGILEIMFPMVSRIEDIRWAKDIVAQEGSKLNQEGIPWDKEVKLGIMMEIPSIMLIADRIVDEVDFASVGTNDLCQYMTASDRLNSGTVDYYQNFHPSIFRLIGYAARVFNEKGKILSVCGEIGGDALAVPILVGLGVKKLSMNITSVAGIKHVLSEMTMDEMRTLAEEVSLCDSEKQVKEVARQYIDCEGRVKDD